MIISSRENIETTIKSCHLFVKEVTFHENDHIKYLKMLNDGYTKNINFFECHTKIFNDKISLMKTFMLITFKIVILFKCMVF